MALRLTSDSSRPSETNTSMGRREKAQLRSTSQLARPPDTSWPVRPTSGSEPTRMTPESRLLSASTATTSAAYRNVASVFPRNTSARVTERVRTVFQVSWRSSLENTSPARMPATSGSPNVVAKLRIVSEVANPVVRAQRPNRVSAGTVLWTRMTSANPIGPTRQTPSRTRIVSCSPSFASSTRSAAPGCASLTRRPPRR